MWLVGRMRHAGRRLPGTGVYNHAGVLEDSQLWRAVNRFTWSCGQISCEDLFGVQHKAWQQPQTAFIFFGQNHANVKTLQYAIIGLRVFVRARARARARVNVLYEV